MSTLKLPPDEFALLRKVIKELSFPVEKNALRELVREVVREELATAEMHQRIGWTPAQVEEFLREMDKAIRKRPDGRLVL